MVINVIRTHHPTFQSFLLHQSHCSFMVESKRKWKWKKAQLVSHDMRGSFWLVQTIFFIDYSWREEKASRGCVILYTFRRKHVDNLLCLCDNCADRFVEKFTQIKNLTAEVSSWSSLERSWLSENIFRIFRIFRIQRYFLELWKIK